MEEKKMKTGTTTVGIVTKNAVIFAADSRATMGYFIASKTARKIHRIADHIALTIAGSVGDAQRLVRWLTTEVESYQLEYGRKMRPKEAATLLANVLSAYKYMPFWVQLLLGGVGKKPELFSIDMVGGVTEEKYTATGSGSPIALGVIEVSYKENLSNEEALALAAKSVWAAIKRDAATGEAISLAIVDKKGFKDIPKEKVLSYLKAR